MDVPVGQAGMGGGLAGPPLALAVATAGGLGTLGLVDPGVLADWIRQFRDGAPDRAVAVNFLMPFVRRRHVEVCVEARIDVAVLAFGGDHALVDQLKDAGVFVFAMVGTDAQVRRAVHWGVDGLIAQGGEAGGHLTGETPALQFLPHALELADGRPVMLAGGIATAGDVKAALAAGAHAVIAGTRFLLTHESGAHREYQRRILAADKTYRTTLFGFGWPAPHRVIANGATERWLHSDGRAKVAPRIINAPSPFAVRLLPMRSGGSLVRWQSPNLPVFSPVAPMVGMPDAWVDRAALYCGESGLRMASVTSAGQAVAELAGA